jgi:hypothetical protein
VVIEFHQFAQSFLLHYDLEFTQLVIKSSTGGRYKKNLWSTERPVREADNLTVICEPIL